MTLSIIIPVYNTEQYLRECLDSVLVTNLFAGEVICVNDGSADDCEKILAEYANRYSNVRVISQSNQGLSVARNVGIKHASGDYILFLDSDDYLLPNTIPQILDKLESSFVNVWVGNFMAEKQTPLPLMTEIIPQITTGKEAMTQMILSHVYMPSAVLYICQRTFILDNQLFFEKGLYYEDEMWATNMLLCAKTIKALGCRYYFYRYNPDSITNTSMTIAKAQSIVKISKVLYKIACESENPLRQCVALRAYILQRDLARNKQWKPYQPLSLKNLWQLRLSYIGFRDSVYYLYPASHKLTRWTLRALYYVTHWR